MAWWSPHAQRSFLLQPQKSELLREVRPRAIRFPMSSNAKPQSGGVLGGWQAPRCLFWPAFEYSEPLRGTPRRSPLAWTLHLPFHNIFRKLFATRGNGLRRAVKPCFSQVPILQVQVVGPHLTLLCLKTRAPVIYFGPGWRPSTPHSSPTGFKDPVPPSPRQ